MQLPVVAETVKLTILMIVRVVAMLGWFRMVETMTGMVMKVRRTTISGSVTLSVMSVMIMAVKVYIW